MKLSPALLAGGAAIALVMGGTATTLASVASAETTNLIPNPGFESDTSGWALQSQSGATMARVAGGHTGSYAAAVTAKVKSSPVLTDGPAAFVGNTTAGVTYKADIWVRSADPRTIVSLQLQELSNSSVVAKQYSKRTLHTTGWTEFTTSLTARGSQHVLDFQVIGVAMRGGTSFLADDAIFTSTGASGASSPTPTPTSTPTSTPTATPTSSATTTSAPSPSTSPTASPSTSAPATTTSAPPSGGYFSLVPAGKFSSLPTDAQAAAMVHRSSWEPRPQNATANHTVPPSTFTTAGYSGMQNHAALFGRVTGNFTGTTDEIIQWAAAKWGLPDEVIRADAVDETNWYQNLKTSSGAPISGSGYGDFGSCSGQGSPPPSGYGTSGPSSFGLLQTKWCTLKDSSASGYGGWPWTENSTAYELDLYASVIRGCYEGWDTWLGGSYHAGDLWGCLGRWFSGQWYSSDANSYISRVQNFYNTKPWLTWKG